ncbi:Ceramide glucosyltransferase [Blastocladiella emersonii ATCC 22665]|nr:Ceramide glucosyltransferase [Blastocladiella emersonii ATCC 22665]
MALVDISLNLSLWPPDDLLVAVAAVWYLFCVLVMVAGIVTSYVKYNPENCAADPPLATLPPSRPRSRAGSVSGSGSIRPQQQPSDPNHHHGLPKVTILRPLKGIDCSIERNLDACFHLDYPRDCIEMIFCVADDRDPVLPLVKRVMDTYAAEFDVKLYVGEQDIGINPKIRNLLRGYTAARHDIVWVLDSNVWVAPPTLRRSVTALLDPRIGLVHHLPVGIRAHSLGAELEAVFLNVAHARLYLGINWLAPSSCVIGKSTLFRRSDLALCGGLGSFAKYMAEDNMIGQAIWDLGLRHAMTPDRAWQTLGSMPARDFFARRQRWGRIRKYTVRLATAVEPLTECLVLSAIFAFALRGILARVFGVPPPPFAAAWLAHVAAWLTADWGVARNVAGKDANMSFPAFLRAWTVREASALATYVWAVAGSTVAWRDLEYELLPGGTVELASKQKQQRKDTPALELQQQQQVKKSGRIGHKPTDSGVAESLGVGLVHLQRKRQQQQQPLVVVSVRALSAAIPRIPPPPASVVRVGLPVNSAAAVQLSGAVSPSIKAAIAATVRAAAAEAKRGGPSAPPRVVKRNYAVIAVAALAGGGALLLSAAVGFLLSCLFLTVQLFRLAWMRATGSPVPAGYPSAAAWVTSIDMMLPRPSLALSLTRLATMPGAVGSIAQHFYFLYSICPFSLVEAIMTGTTTLPLATAPQQSPAASRLPAPVPVVAPSPIAASITLPPLVTTAEDTVPVRTVSPPAQEPTPPPEASASAPAPAPLLVDSAAATLLASVPASSLASPPPSPTVAASDDTALTPAALPSLSPSAPPSPAPPSPARSSSPAPVSPKKRPSSARVVRRRKGSSSSSKTLVMLPATPTTSDAFTVQPASAPVVIVSPQRSSKIGQRHDAGLGNSRVRDTAAARREVRKVRRSSASSSATWTTTTTSDADTECKLLESVCSGSSSGAQVARSLAGSQSSTTSTVSAASAEVHSGATAGSFGV